MEPIQLKKSYYDKYYDSFGRYICLYNQINIVKEYTTTKNKILEIGVGTGMLSYRLNILGYKLTTMDHNPELDINIVGDITKIPFKNLSFDSIIAFEILEHIPYHKTMIAMKELHRVVKDKVFISLPYTSLYINLILDIPIIQMFKSFNFRIRLPTKAYFDGHHYWEIGKQGYSLKKIIKDFKQIGFDVIHCSKAKYEQHQIIVLQKI